MKFALLEGNIENFKSFRGKHHINFGAIGPGAHRVRGFNDDNERLGSNGSGKSTLLSDALSWCLFGRTASGLRNPDVRPWNGKGNTRVQFQVRVGGNDVFIQRTINPSRLMMGEDGSDWKNVGQEDIGRFLGMTFETFTHTILLAQARPLFFDKTPRDKMQLFSDVLELDRWDARAKLASERARDQEREFDRVTGSLDALKEALRRVNTELPIVKASVFEWDERRQKAADGVEDVVKEMRLRLGKVERELLDADLAIDGAGMNINHVAKDVEAARSMYRVAQDAYSEASAKAQGAQMHVGRLRAELKGLEFGSTCPTCKQKIKAGSVTKHRTELKARIAKAKKGTIIASDILEAADDSHAKLKALELALHNFEEQQRVARDVMDRVVPKHENAKANLKIALARQDEKNNELNPHKAEWAKLRAQKRTLKESITKGEELLDLYERKITRSKFWIKGFKDMRLYLVEDVLQELTIATNAALEEVGLIGWSVDYTIEKETKSGSAQQGLFVMIKSPANDKAVRWEAWSGGEGQRLRLIGALALAEVLLAHAGIEPEIEILDEPTRHMSPEGVRDVAEYLILRAKDMNRQIFYVDHQAVDSRAFASTITIAKDRKGSYIVEV